ncbi:MAG TPA: PilZ domain-containing protein [Xanthobacteraceae bacterium]|nr:PilZ domain-containing protein [Xanthobacteraceae bacterium]
MSALAQQQPESAATPDERRRFQRVRVHLLGRYMLPNRKEYPCQVVNMSPGGAALLGQAVGFLGDRVVAYIDHIGRIEGKITRHIDGGFAMSIEATARKRDKLASQLTYLANREILNLVEDRRHERVVPQHPTARIVFDDGLELSCNLIDVSQSGAAVAAKFRPQIGTLVTIGVLPARVVRHLDNGFALQFTHEQPIETLEDRVTAR